MSCNDENCNCQSILSLLREYFEILDDDGTLIDDEEEWSDRIEEIRSELKFLVSTN